MVSASAADMTARCSQDRRHTLVDETRAVPGRHIRITVCRSGRSSAHQVVLARIDASLREHHQDSHSIVTMRWADMLPAIVLASESVLIQRVYVVDSGEGSTNIFSHTHQLIKQLEDRPSQYFFHRLPSHTRWTFTLCN